MGTNIHFPANAQHIVVLHFQLREKRAERGHGGRVAVGPEWQCRSLSNRDSATYNAPLRILAKSKYDGLATCYYISFKINNTLLRLDYILLT